MSEPRPEFEALIDAFEVEHDALITARGALIATSHGFTPSTSPFTDGSKCEVMLARYRCPYSREQHPDLPPEDVDAFGYIRRSL